MPGSPWHVPSVGKMPVPSRLPLPLGGLRGGGAVPGQQAGGLQGSGGKRGDTTLG